MTQKGRSRLLATAFASLVKETPAVDGYQGEPPLVMEGDTRCILRGGQQLFLSDTDYKRVLSCCTRLSTMSHRKERLPVVRGSLYFNCVQ